MYSYSTSLPAYQENQAVNKKRQCDEILAFIKRGVNNLLQLAELTGLPQSTVAARINDLKDERKADYLGHTIYKDRKRKKIIVIEVKPVEPLKLF